MQKDSKYSEMFEEIDREFFKDESSSNRFSSTNAASKKDVSFSFAIHHPVEMQKVLQQKKRDMKLAAKME